MLKHAVILQEAVCGYACVAFGVSGLSGGCGSVAVSCHGVGVYECRLLCVQAFEDWQCFGVVLGGEV